MTEPPLSRQGEDTPTAGVTVDPWDPGYAAAVASEALTDPEENSTAELHLDVETPASQWAPVEPDTDTESLEAVLVLDGVRRIDARIWVDDPDGATPTPGIAASYAAGVVRCGTSHGNPAILANARVEHAAFTASSRCPDLHTASGSYRARLATKPTPDALNIALQQSLAELEVAAATDYRQHTNLENDLLVIDGPLRGHTHLARAVGYVKTHHTAYLPPEQAKTVTALTPGQRSPLFLMGTSWSRYAWYLRLPTRSTAPWAGVIRCEASPDLTTPAAARFAGLTAALLPSLAGVDYKDSRAPQNLIPLAGLERILRHRLGDPQLLYRALRQATRT